MRPVLHAVDEVIEVIRASIGDRAVVMGAGDRLCNEWQINPDVTTQGQNLMHDHRWANYYGRVMMRMGLSS
jgi:hypothetical protein